MEFTTENEIKKVPTGVKVIAILEFIFQGFAILGYFSLLALASAGQELLNSSGAGDVEMPGKGIIIAGLLISIAVVIGSAMILAKKKVGVYLFAIAIIISFILGIVTSGFGISSIIGLILPGLMIYFIMQEKEIFGL